MKLTWLTTLILAFAAQAGHATVIRVAQSGSSGDGSSWESAKTTIQAAITAASSGDEIWVKRGTYIERIVMKDGVSLYGGFAGNETERDQRDWINNETVIDNNNLSANPVVKAVGTAANPMIGRIDGFTLTRGTGVRSGSSPNYQYKGGGIYCEYVSDEFVIANNKITNNRAITAGGGIYLGAGCSPLIQNNLITGNYGAKTDNTSGSGGGIYVYASSSAYPSNPTIVGNTISNNRGATGGGGIMCLYFCSPKIVGNKITSNIAKNNTGAAGPGGGIYISNQSNGTTIPLIANNIISDNEGSNGGAGIMLYSYASGTNIDAIVVNNVIAGNRATYSTARGGGIHIIGGTTTLANNTIADNTSYNPGGGVYITNNPSPLNVATVTMINNIIATNTNYGIGRDFGNVNLVHNDVWGNTVGQYYGVAAGSTDISANPLFVDQTNKDYHLTSISPCKDTGDSSVLTTVVISIPPGWTDIDSDTRPSGESIDIGADEFVASDTTPPTIEAVNVSPHMVAAGDTVLVQVTATDESGIDTVSADSVVLTHSSGNLWQGNVPANPALGIHTVNVVVTDTASNQAVDTTGSYKAVKVYGANNRALHSAVAAQTSSNCLFLTWGRVSSVVGDEFTLNDGSELPLKVIAPGHSVEIGSFVSVRGIMHVEADPKELHCNPSHIVPMD